MPNLGRNSGRGYRVSREYQKYLESEKDNKNSYYEKLAKKISQYKEININDIPFPDTIQESLNDNIKKARLDVSSDQILSLALLPQILFLPLAIISFFLIPRGFAFLVALIPIAWMYWVISYPSFKGIVTKIRFSDESLRVILHMAMRLERNPNLERAVRASVDYTEGPLSEDFAKIMWDTEIQKKSNVRKAISERMDIWSEWSPEFVESLELLLDSVAATDNEREHIINKSQSKMISSVKSKMQQYARNLSSPVKVINMAGILLPLMGLIMFPLITIFLSEGQGIGLITVYMAFGYIILLPTFLLFLIKRVISKRPGAYSHPPLKNVPNLPPKDKLEFELRDSKYSLPLKKTSILIAFIIMIPGLLYFADLIFTIQSYSGGVEIQGSQVSTSQNYSDFISQQYSVENLVPNILQSMTVFWGLIAGLFTYFMGKSYRRKKVRDRIEEIEEGLELGLTEMENSFSKGKPAERVLYDVINKYDEVDRSEHPLRSFFADCLNLVQQQGYTFKRSIFDSDSGIINYYPSDLLENSLKVVTSSVSKGPKSTAKSIRSVNKYISNKRETEELIKQLLDETVSQMKIQAKFITPIITAMAASMSVVIVQVLNSIAKQLEELEGQLSVGGGSSVSGGITETIPIINELNSAIPPTLLLLIVSIYSIEVSLILAYFTNGIENGFDKINRDITISKNLIYSGLIFSIIVIIAATEVTPFVTEIG